MNNQLILKAAHFTAQKHRDQRRKDKEVSPYINHPISVAKIISEIGNIEDAEVLAAALLHDTIEDTETIVEELIDNFGERVCSLVQEVTDDKTTDDKPREDDAKVKITVDIQADSDSGFNDDLVRTVSENSNALNINQHGFEDE